MSQIIRKIIPLSALLMVIAFANGQTKTVTKSTSKTTSTKQVSASKHVEKAYASPVSISEVKDLKETDAEYTSVMNLVEKYNVRLIYEDNTFRSKEPLKKGDFIVALNDALSAYKKIKDSLAVDTSLVNTYDKKRGGAYLTSVDQVKDIKSGSIYYPAAKSLIEDWGIAAPFSANKTLNAASNMSEKEAFDILRESLGYSSAGINPYSTAITRGKFAIALNNAIMQRIGQIYMLHSQQKAQ